MSDSDANDEQCSWDVEPHQRNCLRTYQVANCIWLHCALAAVQCTVIGPVCGFVCLLDWYHDNSKLHASIFTKLGLLVKVVTISSWLNFGHPAPPREGVCSRAKIFGSPYCSRRAVFASLWALFSFETCFSVQSRLLFSTFTLLAEWKEGAFAFFCL